MRVKKMEENKICHLCVSLCRVLVVFLIAAGGCDSSKSTGEFSDVEMAVIPLAVKQSQPAQISGLVLSINTETITVDEVIASQKDVFEKLAGMGNFERFRRQAQPMVQQSVLQKVTEILLYQQAKKTVPDNIDELLKKAVDSEVSRFIARCDGNYIKAQKTLENMGMDWQGFRDYQKKMILSQSYISQVMDDDEPVSHSELLARYNAMKDDYFHQDGNLEFWLIDIVVSDPNGTGYTATAAASALEKANMLLEKIRAGEDFEQLATENSDGHLASKGGLWTPTPGALAEPFDVLETEADKIEPGEVAGPIKAGKHVFVMKLKSKTPQGYQSFEEVQNRVKAEIHFLRQKKQTDDLVMKLIEQANIANMDTFINFCVETAYRRFALTQ